MDFGDILKASLPLNIIETNQSPTIAVGSISNAPVLTVHFHTQYKQGYQTCPSGQIKPVAAIAENISKDSSLSQRHIRYAVAPVFAEAEMQMDSPCLTLPRLLLQLLSDTDPFREDAPPSCTVC
jgi:hypothetical protein